MPSITFINAAGDEQKVEGDTGTSLMQIAMDEDVEEIVAECGGGCACATCHCYIDEAWMAKVGEPNDFESEMLDCTTEERKPNSRLSCQIILSDEMDGLIVRLPEEQ